MDKKVLIIEDDDIFRDVLSDLLQQEEGYSIMNAGDGEQGLRRLLNSEEKPDILITDIFMPNKNGLEVIGECRQKYPNIRIIAISGGGAARDMSYLEMAKSMGADKLIEKPLRPKDVLEAIKELSS